MKFGVLFAVVVISIVGSVGFLNNSIALTAQEFGSSEITDIESSLSDAVVNFTFDFTDNTISSCDVRTSSTLNSGNILRCQVFGETSNLLTQGYSTADGESQTMSISLESSPLIDDVESVKILFIGGDEEISLICHIPPGNSGNSHTISVSANAVSAHLNHGDSTGACT